MQPVTSINKVLLQLWPCAYNNRLFTEILLIKWHRDMILTKKQDHKLKCFKLTFSRYTFANSCIIDDRADNALFSAVQRSFETEKAKMESL